MRRPGILNVPYPRLSRSTRRAIRKIFALGLLFPDAMHHAIWGINEGATITDVARYRAALTELADGDNDFPEEVKRIALEALEG